MAFNFKGLGNIFNNPKTLNLIKMGVQNITEEINKVATDLIDRRVKNLTNKSASPKQNTTPPQPQPLTLEEEMNYVKNNYSPKEFEEWKKSKGL